MTLDHFTPGRRRIGLMSGGSLFIDCTHMGRRQSGIERVTRELFNAEVFGSIPVRQSGAPSQRLRVFVAQIIGIPWQALSNSKDVFVFPGFPPSPLMALARERCVVYVHDLFLLTRRSDLNLAGKLYMAPSFALAVRKLKYFLVNSEETGRALRALCRSDAQVLNYRPHIRNVFDLGLGDRVQRGEPAILRVVAIGTVEPRKNFLAASDICAAIGRRFGRPVELHIIGRHGWGHDANELSRRTGTVLHGPLSDTNVREVVDSADIFICSSHDEGLGLPLLEVQYGGLPVVAPDKPVFQEVLGSSGIFVNPEDPERAATIIIEACSGDNWRQRHAQAALANLQRWNEMARDDRRQVVEFLGGLLAQCANRLDQ